jgi:hypothetical protein
VGLEGATVLELLGTAGAPVQRRRVRVDVVHVGTEQLPGGVPSPDETLHHLHE